VRIEYGDLRARYILASTRVSGVCVASFNTTLVLALVMIVLGTIVAGYTLLQLQQPGESSRIPNGIYMWDGTRFVPLNVTTAYVPKEPGYYFIYFHNNLCPHCQAFYPEWIRYLREYGGVFRNITVIEVACDWFTEQCSNTAARNTFQLYQISSSPSFLLIRVGVNGTILNIWDIGREYIDLQRQGIIPQGEFQPAYLESIVRSKIS